MLEPRRGKSKLLAAPFTPTATQPQSYDPNCSRGRLSTVTAATTAKSLQSCPTLCDPIEGSQPGSSIPGILQARILKWVAVSFSNACMHAKSLQLCPTLCDPMDSSPPGSSVHRIFQARILENPMDRGAWQAAVRRVTKSRTQLK